MQRPSLLASPSRLDRIASDFPLGLGNPPARANGATLAPAGLQTGLQTLEGLGPPASSSAPRTLDAVQSDGEDEPEDTRGPYNPEVG